MWNDLEPDEKIKIYTKDYNPKKVRDLARVIAPPYDVSDMTAQLGARMKAGGGRDREQALLRERPVLRRVPAPPPRDPCRRHDATMRRY